jgi:hypothetical protein
MIEPLESENRMEWNEIWPTMECDKEMDTTTPGDYYYYYYKINEFETCQSQQEYFDVHSTWAFYNNTQMYQKSSNGNKLCILQGL